MRIGSTGAQREHFTAFITHPWGLDASLELILRICADDLEALDVLDRVTTQTPGNKTGANQYTRAAEPVPRPQPPELMFTGRPMRPARPIWPHYPSWVWRVASSGRPRV